MYTFKINKAILWILFIVPCRLFKSRGALYCGEIAAIDMGPEKTERRDVNMENRKTNAADQTVDRLRALILNDTYPMGAPLRQAEIADNLGVSRTPVREALKTLAREGLVEITPTGRTCVAKVDPNIIRERFEIRCQLELWMLELAIPVMAESDLAKAEAINAAMASCAREDWGELNFRFHGALYGPANKPLALAMVKDLYNGSRARLRNPIYSARNVERSLRDHKELIALCAAGNVQAACDRLESHIILHSLSLLERLRAMRPRA